MCEFTRLYPLSQVVESATSYQATEREDRRGDGIRIALVDGRFGEKLELDIDRSGRLVERRCLGRGLERHAFGECRKVTAVDGSTVDVPTRVVYSYCTGPLADGTYATWQTRTFELTDIKLNEDIPDHVFAPPFPPGIEVYDGLHGLGWIKAENIRSTPPAPTPAPFAWRWWTIYAGLPILLTLLGAIVAMRLSR